MAQELGQPLLHTAGLCGPGQGRLSCLLCSGGQSRRPPGPRTAGVTQSWRQARLEGRLPPWSGPTPGWAPRTTMGKEERGQKEGAEASTGGTEEGSRRWRGSREREGCPPAGLPEPGGPPRCAHAVPTLRRQASHGCCARCGAGRPCQAGESPEPTGSVPRRDLLVKQKHIFFRQGCLCSYLMTLLAPGPELGCTGPSRAPRPRRPYLVRTSKLGLCISELKHRTRARGRQPPGRLALTGGGPLERGPFLRSRGSLSNSMKYFAQSSL